MVWLGIMLAVASGCGSDENEGSTDGPAAAGTGGPSAAGALAIAEGGSSAQGGGGSSEGGGGAGPGGRGGQDSGLPAPRGASNFIVSSSGCELPQDSSYLIPYEAIEPVSATAQGTRVTDGVGNATVQCVVSGQGTGYVIDATLTQGDRSFAVRALVAPGVGGEYSGSGTISNVDPEAGTLESAADGCTVVVLPDQQIGVSRVWAEFDCAAVSDPGASERLCSAQGSFAFDYCAS